MSITDHILPISGAIGVSLAAGCNLATSILTVPPLLQSPPRLLATQWSQLFYRGASMVAPLATGAGIAFTFLSYRGFQRSDPRARSAAQAYAIAAVCSLSLGPYTSIIMGNTNNTLLAAREKALKLGVDGVDLPGVDVKALVRQWSSMNFGRGIMLLTGAVASIYATTVDV